MVGLKEDEIILTPLEKAIKEIEINKNLVSIRYTFFVELNK